MPISKELTKQDKTSNWQVNLFDPEGMKERILELNEEMAEPDFWLDQEKAQKKNKELSDLEGKVKELDGFNKSIDDIFAMIELGIEMEDEEVQTEVARELEILEKRIEKLQLETMLTGEYDSNNAILTLHAGAGGTEAQDWTDMLFRMYRRYCEKSGYQVEILDYLAGDEAGTKSVTFRAQGLNAYGFMKAEKGVHRLVRISPFDSNARRHTSFASLEVMPEIEEDNTIVIPPEDIEVETRRSTGAGGQHINKTESAIRIIHKPTGIIVQCQQERSQIQNRETAMNMLRSKLIELREREREEKELELRGDVKKIEWGSQIRSYVFHPYNMVKDHRTNAETSNIQAVMDGELDMFIRAYLGKRDKE
ncbi:MAG: peptide chain release factor 2 [Clostridia bacterium]|nr:peptide chain release factor 2 [Clostridia bacterium]